jgi:hypothetical protein
MARDVERLRESDATTGIKFHRFVLHFWPLLAGAVTWASPAWSTETHLLVARGLPDWSLGAGLLGGGVLLLMARLTARMAHSRWAFVVGDFIVGAACLTMAAIMAVGWFHHRASGISACLWLFIGLNYQMHTVLRIRG